MLSADNLRYFLEVARAGRLSDASRVLEVDHTTVGRRITALERSVGERLFDRAPSGWRLTEAGKRMMPRAEAVESAVMAAYDVQGATPDILTGSIRITATDGFGAFIIAPHLVELKAAHPRLTVELVTATVHNAVSERHFDVAVTLERPTSRAVRSEVLCHYDLGLYATPEYLNAHPPIAKIADLRAHTLIWYVNALMDVEPLRILDELPHVQSVDAQISNITGHWLAARSGLGVAPLPAYIANGDERLIRVLPDAFSVRRLYWLVVPRELERLERVRTVCAFLRDTVEAHPDLNLGRRSP
ncbi:MULTISPECIES: LysR family transcriptional regulator [Mycobacteriaceae]|uniref:LysR family transcriptional regulator n=1 Tax=Mycolicibacterium neoaurum VKM Ac-1815D TaxID=700508 RepID=V5X9P8_MYCNE|nr:MULTISPECIES: LysR family transcriptional regulator [Mycobacteriaceae]AHC24727.1 LysR family transcriptional regulator [Mycolicibacterium neoaurum VKM Ac-1815D]AMO05281.1 LysR family transcriptional regulator [Mycolicibacterium neoaurum]AXK76407.1 LysR family transcriptional regulator [Mycolicibacterium neoaurum]KJQ50862.1 LysR family transcriptional regulator [Mycolicibacterium neoaurum]KUM10071.1 LysR family transcriptional regulator [Mycolicibacterium neoaurum]